jgi:hypothetical protein
MRRWYGTAKRSFGATNYYNEHLSAAGDESSSTGFPLYGFLKDQVFGSNTGIVQYLQQNFTSVAENVVHWYRTCLQANGKRVTSHWYSICICVYSLLLKTYLTMTLPPPPPPPPPLQSNS